jgi:dTDP-glucose pyrophosphorylase
MNVLILMAGSSEPFQQAGYQFPKPLIEIGAKPLVQLVIEELKPLLDQNAQPIFIVRAADDERFHISSVIKLLEPGARIIEMKNETSGAACTALLAVDLIGNSTPLLLVNGDQLVTSNLKDIIKGFQRKNLDGGIIVFEDIHPRWSFVKCDNKGLVIEAAEKRPISNMATAGIYYFKTGADFCDAAKSMILKDASVAGKFYVCPVYNELIIKDRKIGVSRIRKDQYISLATPQGVQSYQQELKGPKPKRK